MTRSEVAESWGSSVLNLLRDGHTFSKQLRHVTFPRAGMRAPSSLSLILFGKLASISFRWCSWSDQPTLHYLPPKSPLFFRAPLGSDSPHIVSNKVTSLGGSLGVLLGTASVSQLLST